MGFVGLGNQLERCVPVSQFLNFSCRAVTSQVWGSRAQLHCFLFALQSHLPHPFPSLGIFHPSFHLSSPCLLMVVLRAAVSQDY